MNLDKTFCMQEHQIELCKSCERNFKKLFKTKLDRPVSMTIFTPKSTPKQTCKGYLK